MRLHALLILICIFAASVPVESTISRIPYELIVKVFGYVSNSDSYAFLLAFGEGFGMLQRSCSVLRIKGEEIILTNPNIDCLSVLKTDYDFLGRKVSLMIDSIQEYHRAINYLNETLTTEQFQRKTWYINLEIIGYTEGYDDEIPRMLQSANNKIVKLTLGFNFLESFESIPNAIVNRNCELTSLLIMANPVDSSLMHAFSEALKHPNNKLITLNFDMNRITDKEISILASSLEHQNCKLLNLGFQSNRIKCAGAKVLAKVINQGKCKLKSLNLASNRIGNQAAKSFLKLLQSGSNLDLDLSNNYIKSDLISNITTLLNKRQ